jgi:hypothetical protein
VPEGIPPNNAASTLTSSMTNSQTTAILASGTAFPSGAAATYRVVFADPVTFAVTEIAEWTGARSGATLSGLTRGQEGTTAVTHAIGEIVACVLTESGVTALLAAKSATTHTHAHSALTSVTADQHHDKAHAHDATDGTAKLAQANTHQTPDTDLAPSSLHHTTGTGANQAAAGNHAHALAGHDHTASAGDGGTLTNDTHDGYSDYAEIATPATPSANHGRLYGKDVGGLSLPHWKDEGGTEYDLTSAGSPASHNHTAAGGDGGVLTNDEHDGYAEFAEIATPSTPAANKGRLYAKDVSGASLPHWKTEAGTEIDLTSVGSGGHALQDEGTPLTSRANLNFVGAGVAATDDAGNNATVVTISGGGGSTPDYLCYEDQKSSGTSGGTFTSGAWRTRDLNTEVADAGGHGTLSANQVTLAAGTYEAIALASAFGVQRSQVRIQDVTNAVTLLLGPLGYAASTTDSTGLVVPCEGRFTLAGSAAIEVQHRGSNTQGTNGFGVSASWGTEVYCHLGLRKVA